MRPRTSRLTAAAFAVFAVALALPSSADAQRSGWVAQSFKSASAGENGFLHGQLLIDYQFGICAGGRVRLTYSVRPGSSRGYEGYWFEGRMYGLQSGWNAPPTPALSAQWRIGFGAQTVKTWQKRDPYITDNLSCSTGSQWMDVGDIAQFVGKGKTRQEQEEALNRFTFTVDGADAPMRSREVESAIRQQIAGATAKARQDSLAKARIARQDSLARVAKAREDSITKARQARSTGGNGVANGPSGATPPAAATTGTVAGQGRVRPGTTTTLDRTGARSNGAAQQPAGQQRQETYDERMARQHEERRQAQRDSAIASEARRREALANLERQRQETAERNARIEESSEKLAQATVGLMSSIGDIRRANAAERERKEAIRQERIARHYRDARMAYLSRPPQPRCVPASMPTSRFDLKQGTSGTITGNECELEDSTSAVRYTFTVDKPGELQVWAGGPNDFTGQIRVTRILDGGRETGAGAHLTPGTYALYVSGLVPGETGAFTVAANYLPPYLTGGWGFGGAPFLGSYTIGEISESGFGMIGRISYGFSERFSAVAAIDYAQAGDEFPGGWQAGGRAHLPIGSKRRIGYLQLTTGKSYLETFTGTVSAVGAGVELFSDRSMGLEIGLVKSFGSLKDADFPAGGSIDYGATMLTFGLTTR